MANILKYLSIIIGTGSMTYFVIFLFFHPVSIINFDLNFGKTLWFDFLLSFIFFLQHSLMARKTTQKKLLKMIPEKYYHALYSIISGIVLLTVLILWQKTSLIYSADFYLKLIFQTLFFLSMAGCVWSINTLNYFDPFGVKRLKKPAKKNPGSFIIKGPYKIVRHPIYLFTLIMIWSAPELTGDRLLFNIIWSLWIFFGAVLEDKDLASEFGDSFLDYKSKVPSIFPFKR